MGICMENALTRQFSKSPKLPPHGGLLTQPYDITDTSFKDFMWQEKLSFNCGKGLVYSLYSFDTTAVYVLCVHKTSSHAAPTLTHTLKWFKKKFLEQIALTSKISASAGQIIHQNVGILVLFHPMSLSFSLASQISHKSPLSAEREHSIPL